MPELIYCSVVLISYITAYIMSLYSMAVYIDPDDLSTLQSNVTGMRHNFLRRLADDPQLFVQIAAVYNSFALVTISILTYHYFYQMDVPASWPRLALPLTGLVMTWVVYILTVEYLPRRSSRNAINPRMKKHLWFILIVYYLAYPLVRAYRGILASVTSETLVTEEEKEEIVERAIETLAEQAGISESLVEEDEREMISQIFQLDQTVVREIMIPRIQITAIDNGMSFGGIRRLVLKDGHSRYPVYDGSIDKVVGLIYVKDLFNRLPEPGEKFEISSFLRKPYFVPETKIISDLLREFKSRRLHIAMVVDEYGGLAGLVTLEDIIEEIFGEIQDEHDSEQAEFTVLPDGRYQVDAGLMVEDLQERLEIDYEQGDYDTVGGLIYDLVGSVPHKGQIVKWHDLEFVVDKINGQRIVSVTVTLTRNGDRKE
ncbi:MAG: hemolysin family protein [candidate division Zixibacteria bacterium]|nr:hemolysin family protein [candidate division Zixibacteria bacterium]